MRAAFVFDSSMQIFNARHVAAHSELADSEEAAMTADYFAIYKSMGLTSDSDKAAALQKSVIADEAEQLAEGNANYSKEHATQAAVHTRQDLVFVVSHIAGLNRKQTILIRRLNIVIVLLLFIALLEAFR